MTSREKKANVESLWRGIEVQTKVMRGFGILEQTPRKELNELLRHHSKGSVGWAEVNLRDCVDLALGSVSQLAVATVSGYVPAKWEGPLAVRIGKVLSIPATRLYYEKHYRLYLPSLMRMACTEGLRIPQEDEAESWGAFQWFWRNGLRFQDDSDLKAFLWLLDGGSFGAFGLAQFQEELRDPMKALGGVVKPFEMRSALETCTIGMVRFFEFSKELGDGLAEMKRIPLTASAIWFHYAYWYKEFAKLETHMRSLLWVMKKWVDSSRLGVHSLREAEADIEKLTLRLSELIRGDYSKMLVDAYQLESVDDKRTRMKVATAMKKADPLRPKAKEELRAVLTYFEKYRPEKATS